MYTDTIPIPSKGIFYENPTEYLEVKHLTTEDELMMTSPNLFNKGDALYKLLDKAVCQLNDIKLDDILVNDKEFILLWLRENAYGHIIENEEVKDEKVETFYFDTRSLTIKNISIMPDDGPFFTMLYDGKYSLKIKLITIGDEKLLRNSTSKLNYYASHIYSINGNVDKKYINHFFMNQPILKSRLITKFIDRINFGVVKKTTCLINNSPIETTVDIDELFFGYNLNNLTKINKAINSSIFFLLNEGQGYTNSDVLAMPTFQRKFNEDKLVEKINKINEQLKQK